MIELCLGKAIFFAREFGGLWWWVAKEVRGLTNPCSLWRKTSAWESGTLTREGAKSAPL